MIIYTVVEHYKILQKYIISLTVASFNAKKLRASVTIIIVTFVYLLFNIPVLVHVILMILLAFRVRIFK